MDPAFRDPESSNDLLINVDRNCCFQEMFSDLSGSFRVIMTTISAGKPGRIDGSNRDCIVREIEDFQGTLQENIEVDGFDPVEKFLECCEVRNGFESYSGTDSIHLFEVTNHRSVIFLPGFFEQQDCQKLMLGIISPRIFT